MTVYVDELKDYGDMVEGYARRWGTIWCHLTCGGDCEELHTFAQRLGLRTSYAQHMEYSSHFFHHYDLVPTKRALAVRLGAVEKTTREIYTIHESLLSGEV